MAREMDRDSYIKKLEAELSHYRGAQTRACDEAQEKGYYEVGGQMRQETPQEKIDYLFTLYDDPDKTPHYVEIREAAKSFALVILRHGSAGSDDQRTAIQHVRQAVMFANASVGLGGRGI